MMAARQPTWGDLFQMPTTITASDLLRMPDDGAKNELYVDVTALLDG